MIIDDMQKQPLKNYADPSSIRLHSITSNIANSCTHERLQYWHYMYWLCYWQMGSISLRQL